MREREKAQRPSRPPVDGAAKPRSKSSSRTSSTKPTSSSSAPKASTSVPKKSTSSSSKSTTSGSKSSTSGSKSSTSGSKLSGSSSKPSTSKTVPSSTRPPKTPGSTSSSSSRPAKTSGSTSSSSRTQPALELKPEKLPVGSSKTNTSSSREGRKVGEGPGHRESSRSNRTSSRRDEKTSGPASRESRRGDKSTNRTEKDVPSSRTDKSSASRGKGERKSDAGRERAREDKSSRSQGRSRDAGSTSKSEKREHTSSSRRGVGSESSSRSSKDTSSKTKSSDKSRSDRSSSKKDAERSKEKSRSNKDDKNRENKERSKEKSDDSDRKSSRPREKSARRREKPVEEIKEDRDSGIEGLGIQGSIIGQSSKGSEVEVVEHNQNSLDTMESGISLSSPRDLSGDEAEVEESISSKMVEVDEVAEEGMQDDDEDEAIDDGGTSQDAFIDETFPSVSNYENSMEPSTSLISHDDIPTGGGAGGAGGDEEEEDYDYEEDFEDYESDFEDDDDDEEDDEEDDDDDSSTVSSSSSSSSASSEAENRYAKPQDPNLAAVLQAMEKENNFDHLLKRVYSFDDEGEDERPLSPEEEERQVIMREIHTAKTAAQDRHHRPKTSRTFVNFAGAKKKQEAAHISSKMNSRGRALLNMIQLDTVSIDLLTMSPVSYEAYISSFGQSNRHQISIQTNEDALSEEIQTDEIVMRNKWTQKPVHISIGKDNQMPGPEDYLGVGGDMDPVNFSELSSGNTSSNRLTSFLTSSSQVMLALLEEELVWETAESNRPNSPSVTTEGLGFSQPPVTLGNNVQSLLEGRTTPFVQFCPNEPSMLLSGHGFHSLDGGDIEDLNDDGLLCVWWVQEPSRPQHLLSCCSSPTSASFSPARPSLVLAGLEDGSLAAWDLREPLQLHTLKIDIDDVKWRVRVPSYVTACGEGGEGEGSAIVAIHTVTTEQDLESDVQGSFQVVTLTASGRVSWWVVIHVPLTTAVGDINIGRKSATSRTNNSSAAVSPHLGASPWARIAINRAATINVANTLYGDEVISNEITCYDLKIDNNDHSQLYVATGSGAVAHCSRHTSRIHPRAYLPEIEPGCEALCLDLCPHDYRYLLVGSSDGLVRLHSIGSDRPLTSWQSAPDCAPIKGLQWSPARPCVFYVLDSSARLHIWDLSAGDIFPVMTVEAGGLVGGSMCSFNIAPTHATSRHPLYAVFASDGGEMVLRLVGPEFGTHQLQEDYDTELERFTYYVNII